MMPVSLAIVTASTDFERARPCLESWVHTSGGRVPIFLMLNGTGPTPLADVRVLGRAVAWCKEEQYLGSVAAFRKGVDVALRGDFSIIACFHDDLEITEIDWDRKVAKYFDRNPRMGLAGFGGATGLGALDMYERPYDPMSLARTGFRSDLEDAEQHGLRSLLAEQVACLDGFSQIGYRRFWEGFWSPAKQEVEAKLRHPTPPTPVERPWACLERLGIVHHLYDGLLGCLAARLGWETWYIPLRAKHWGGRTAVGDRGYQNWAKARDPKGDQGFWEHAHRMGYQEFRDVLPLRV